MEKDMEIAMEREEKLEGIYDFLNGEGTSFIENKSRYIELVKAEAGIRGLYIIHENRFLNEPISEAFTDLENIGVYDGNRKVFYYSDFSPFHSILGDNKMEKILDIDLISIYELLKEIEEDIRKEVISRIGTNENYFSDKILEESLGRLDRIHNNANDIAYEHFMNATEIDDYKYVESVNLEYLTNTNSYILKYLQDRQKLITDFADIYIEKHTDFIPRRIVRNKIAKEILEKFKKTIALLERRKIYNIISDDSRKTINIRLEKEDKQLDCKLETNDLFDELKMGKIFSLNVDSKNRKKFEEMFDYDEKHLDYITRITYSRKVLYERK